MSDTSSNYDFSNLTQSGILRFYSKEDRNISMSFGSFNGSSSFTIFTGSGGKNWKRSIPPIARRALVSLLRVMSKKGSNQRQVVKFTEYDAEAKKVRDVGHIAFIVDDGMNILIEVGGEGLPQKFTFPVKPNARLDFSETDLTERDMFESIFAFLIDTFTISTAVAERLSSFKRPAGGSYGNNNRGGGGNSNYNRSYGQQGSNRQKSGGSFGGVEESDIDI